MQRPWPQHQCSAPADLGYEGRVDSFTDRTSLSPGPQINVLEDPDYLDLTHIEASKPHSTQFLPPVEMIGPGAPKKADLNELIMEEKSVKSSLPERSGAGSFWLLLIWVQQGNRYAEWRACLLFVLGWKTNSSNPWGKQRLDCIIYATTTPKGSVDSGLIQSFIHFLLLKSLLTK